MNETASANPIRRSTGRPPLPFKKKIGKLNLYVTNGLIDRFESAAPSFELAYSKFAEMVIERGLDALEHDQTTSEQPTPKTYNEYSQMIHE
jgi:hypothetical protein